MADEFSNKKIPELNPQRENKLYKENLSYAENKVVKENVFAKENLEFADKSLRKTDKTKARSRAISVMTSSLIGVIGLVVVGMTNLVNIKFKSNFDKVEYRDGHIFYDVSIKDMTEKEYLTLYVYRDTKQVKTIEVIDEDGDGRVSGSFDVDKDYIKQQEELYKGNFKVAYDLDLKGMIGLDVERLFERWTVEIKEFSSYFNEVTGHCSCGEDGYYHFTMDYSDDGELFTNFKAYIYDAFYLESSDEEKEKHIAYCDFTENPHEEQKIFVLNLRGSQATLVVEYTKDGDTQPTKVEMPIEL